MLSGVEASLPLSALPALARIVCPWKTPGVAEGGLVMKGILRLRLAFALGARRPILAQDDIGQNVVRQPVIIHLTLP